MKFTFFFVLIIFSLSAFAQYPKYIVQFRDKNDSPYSLNDPAKYLSAKAIERRIKFNIPLDSSDLPVNPSYINTVLEQGDVRLLSASKWLNQILIYCTDKATIDAIQSLPFVLKTQGIGYRHVMKNVPETITAFHPSTRKNAGDTNTFNYGNSYAQIHVHNGEYLHNKGFTGEGLTMAILDAGFNAYTTISAFDSMRLNNQVLGVKDFVDLDNSVTEDDTHGRYCLSIIAANIPDVMIGSAPKANFWLLRTENSSSEYPVEEHNWVAGAEFADSAGADMISSSLGYNQFDNESFNYTYADFYKNKAMVTKGASLAVNKGMIVTNSAGNEGANEWKYILFPADADSVCTIGAINTGGQIANFSSYGYPGKMKPNIVSVGANTVVAGDNGPVMGSGTSYSNPNIAGLIACLWQAFLNYNNMTILDAVYRSADRYNNPDERYGYDIPNMKKAYRILKHKQNVEFYGNDWLFASPNPFFNEIDTRLIGRVDGTATLQLTDENGTVMAVKSLQTEEEEVYTNSFENLENVPGGNYFIKYTDSLQTRTVSITKENLQGDWLQATPVPFNKQLKVILKAPETGTATLRLITSNGKIVETMQLNLSLHTQYVLHFNNTAFMPSGIYFIEYKSNTQKKAVRVVKVN